VQKYIIHNVAHAYGRRRRSCQAVVGDNGSGMHVHQSVWKAARTCSRVTAMRPVGVRAVLHRRHHQARTRAQRHHQPATNSYKRLVPGFEAPVKLA
jgi:glutamine synthetase